TLGSKFDPSKSSDAISEPEDNTIDEHVESFNYLIDKWENLLAQEVEAKQNENEDTNYNLE
ncbi:8897_t:CDS:2, partial [Gigaspora margarita]